MELEYYVEIIAPDCTKSIGKIAKTYEEAFSISRVVRANLCKLGTRAKGFVVLVKNSLDQVVSFKICR